MCMPPKRKMTLRTRIGRSLWLVSAILAVVVYGLIQMGRTPDPAAVFGKDGDVAKLVSAVKTLEQRAADAPQDYASQRLLAHSYRVMGRYRDAVNAFGKAWPLVRDDATELALFAGTLALYRGSFSGKPDELLQRALARDASQPDALMLKGASAYEKRDFPAAVRTWRQVLNQGGLDDDDRKWVLEQIADASAQAQPLRH